MTRCDSSSMYGLRVHGETVGMIEGVDHPLEPVLIVVAPGVSAGSWVAPCSTRSVVPALGTTVGSDCWSGPSTVAWVLQVGKDCGDPAAEFAFFGQFKFREDGVDVLLDRGLG